ncbi:MAG: helix-turn-helix domain-containing protein [Sphingobacteriales bacterium]|nr:helix-turn-helix domain-containing protein [Sphingobacteriales bacterium]MBP9141603.1 helix-turn-helix domain-containing protein [Chitinophagales bacterium]MDA0198467.1 DNA methyltransferase [Bacteroidota bacterium]MBK7526148.1 helix-turn-helix domain-containing protein [Sphingobacteriales bacterium]MBK8677863.1 helix-turn-helix domain-containing protein [Sphingobacteriales bacterium]
MAYKKAIAEHGEELLTIKEAAELLKVSEISVKRYISKEVIPSVKIGGARRIIKNDIWDNFVEKIHEEHKTNIVAEPQSPYLVKREIEKEEKKTKLGFNGLTPSEWALLSKNVVCEDDVLNPVWNDLSSPRNKYQLEHGAVYPVKLAERLIKMYSAEGDTVFDPFLGIGSTIIAAQGLNRHGVGTELNPKFANIAQQWLDDVQGLFANNHHYKIINDDCRNMLTHIRKDKIQLTVTSPPYADFIQKSLKDRATVHKTSIIKHENNSTVKQYSEHENDFGNLPYKDFLKGIKKILKDNLEITKAGGYSCWVVKDYRDTKNKIPYIPFHSDLARVGEESGWLYQDLIVWDQTGQRRLVLLGYPSVFYVNQNCSFIVVFRKPK